MPRLEPILLSAHRLAICLVVLLPCGFAYAQFALPGSAASKSPIAAATPIAEEQTKTETLLLETQRQREAELPASRELASAESVRAADRQRLLDRLAFLQAERIKRLDELAARQKAPAVALATLPVVQALGEVPPIRPSPSMRCVTDWLGRTTS